MCFFLYCRKSEFDVNNCAKIVLVQTLENLFPVESPPSSHVAHAQCALLVCLAFVLLCLLSAGKSLLEDERQRSGSSRTLGVPRAFGYAREEGVIGLDSSTSLPPATVKSQGAQRRSRHWRGANEERMTGEGENYKFQHAARSASSAEAGCALEPGVGPDAVG